MRSSIFDGRPSFCVSISTAVLPDLPKSFFPFGWVFDFDFIPVNTVVDDYIV